MSLATESSGLARFATPRRALAEARTIGEVKHIPDQTAVRRLYLKGQRTSHTRQRNATAIKLRLERRLGEILAAMNGRALGVPMNRSMMRRLRLRRRWRLWEIARAPPSRARNSVHRLERRRDWLRRPVAAGWPARDLRS